MFALLISFGKIFSTFFLLGKDPRKDLFGTNRNYISLVVSEEKSDNHVSFSKFEIIARYMSLKRF